jgi:hypothetical protein
MLRYHLSREFGIWWVRHGRNYITLKAPWNAPLFSERNGYVKPRISFRGWRLFIGRKS